MNGRKMFRKKSAKQTNARTQPRQANKQMIQSADARCPSSKTEAAQAATATTPKTNLARI